MSEDTTNLFTSPIKPAEIIMNGCRVGKKKPRARAASRPHITICKTLTLHLRRRLVSPCCRNRRITGVSLALFSDSFWKSLSNGFGRKEPGCLAEGVTGTVVRSIGVAPHRELASICHRTTGAGIFIATPAQPVGGGYKLHPNRFKL